MAMTYDGVYSYKMSVLCWSVWAQGLLHFFALCSHCDLLPLTIPISGREAFSLACEDLGWKVGSVGTMEVEEEEGSEEVKDDQL